MTEPLRFTFERLETPIGGLFIVADPAHRLRGVLWADHALALRERLRPLEGEGDFLLEAGCDAGGLTSAVSAYFRGELQAIDALPVAPAGTPFQRAVWAELRRIPCGTTVSYGELARRIGRPSAVRAVGLANGANPVGVVVPCHRVIGADGTLTGFGGGIERKRWLLDHEAAASAATPHPQLSLPLSPSLRPRSAGTSAR